LVQLHGVVADAAAPADYLDAAWLVHSLPCTAQQHCTAAMVHELVAEPQLPSQVLSKSHERKNHTDDPDQR
jgi:hypothetical protein